MVSFAAAEAAEGPIAQKDAAVQAEDYRTANALRTQQQQLEAQIEFLEDEDELQAKVPGVPVWEVGSVVTAQDIAAIVSSWCAPNEGPFGAGLSLGLFQVEGGPKYKPGRDPLAFG